MATAMSSKCAPRRCLLHLVVHGAALCLAIARVQHGREMPRKVLIDDAQHDEVQSPSRAEQLGDTVLG